MMKSIEATLSAHRSESTQTDNQLRLARILHKRIRERKQITIPIIHNNADNKDSH